MGTIELQDYHKSVSIESEMPIKQRKSDDR